MDLIPVQNVEWEEKSDGTIQLLMPKFKREWITKCILRFGQKSHYKMHLDEMGSYVWLQCNGSRPIYQIGKELKNHFGEQANPVYERLASFIRLLFNHNCITYKIQSNS